MAVRWQTYPGTVALVDATPLMRHLGTAIEHDMKAIVPVDTGALRSGIYVDDVTRTSFRVYSGRHVTRLSKHGRPEADDPKVPIYVERGTSKMRAQPYMRPATYRYRSS